MSRTTITILATTAVACAALASPAAAVTEHNSAAASLATARTTVGHARLTLPKGWVAVKANGHISPSWCIRLSGTRACTIRYDEPTLQDPVNPDIQGGYDSDPEYCGPGRGNGPLTRGTVIRWGGREAEYRRWDIRCGREKGPTVVQYVVPTFPASVLLAETGREHGALVDSVMRQIVAGSTLPKQTRPVRLVENGYLRSMVKTKGGYKVSIDRVLFDGRGGVYNTSKLAFGYMVPAKAVMRPVKVGRLVHLRTDGYTGTSLS